MCRHDFNSFIEVLFDTDQYLYLLVRVSSYFASQVTRPIKVKIESLE